MKSIEELKQYREKISAELIDFQSRNAVVVEIAMSTCGITAGAKKILDELMRILDEKGICNVVVKQTGCPGLCYNEPLLSVVHPDESRRVYGGIGVEDVLQIVEEDIINKRPAKKWLINLEK